MRGLANFACACDGLCDLDASALEQVAACAPEGG